MLQAVEAPVRVAAIAGAVVLAGMIAVAPARDEAVVKRLVLHAPEQPGAIYLTAWHDGDVYVRLLDGKPRPLTFQVRARIGDGCEWRATERIVPIGTTGYAYSYDEEILSCRPCALPARKTPRTGFVVAVPQ